MIREANKGKRLEWARANIKETLNSNGFDYVIWFDELHTAGNLLPNGDISILTLVKGSC